MWLRALNCYLNALQMALNICQQTQMIPGGICAKWFFNLWPVVKISFRINILSSCQP